MSPSTNKRPPLPLPPLWTDTDTSPTKSARPLSASSASFPQSTAKSRTSHACDRCRAMRTKCTGGSRCTKCVKDDAICVYGDRKRERNRKDLAESMGRVRTLEETNRELVAMLQQITTTVALTEEVSENIQKLLSTAKTASAAEELSDDTGRDLEQGRMFQSPSSFVDGSGVSSTGMGRRPCGEKYTSSSVGSPGRQGELLKVVDLEHGAGAAGFVGKMSEMSWMQRAREYLTNRSDPSMDMAQNAMSQHAAASQDLAYFMDDHNLLAIDEDHIEPTQWPSYQVILILSESYFRAMNGSCQFVLRDRFFAELHHFQHFPPPSALVERRWLAVANLVWAIGAKWLQLVSMDQGLPENHLFFYARARALGIDHRVLSDHPDVEMIQGIGLLAFYLLINGSISRARNTLGHAIRHATAHGLHLKVVDNSIPIVDQERRARVWFSLYHLEILIAEITGRPTSVHASQTTVAIELLDLNISPQPPPQQSGMQRDAEFIWYQFTGVISGPSQEDPESAIALARSRSEDTSLAMQHYSQYVRLCYISDSVASRLYTGAVERTWSDVQKYIEELQVQLEEWKAALPDNLRFDRASDAISSLSVRNKLALYYYSVSMILHRTCLCEIVIEDESEQSKNFNTASAQACVHAAMSVAEILPDTLVAKTLLRDLPWWTLLHYICQTASVLTLELCLDGQHFQGETQRLLSAVKKVMGCLWYLAANSRSAYRAWRIFRHLLTGLSPRFGGPSMFGLVDTYEHPPAWTEYDEQDISVVLP